MKFFYHESHELRARVVGLGCGLGLGVSGGGFCA